VIVADTGAIVALVDADDRHHAGLRRLVDSLVMAVAERRKAEAIATLDLRHFWAVALRNHPRLVPRDLNERA
jgi:predicted nucleic acid-binding protein